MTLDLSRQIGLFDPMMLQYPVRIIGAGTIGSHTAYCLAKMGVTDITVFDGDAVGPENVSPQMYRPCDVGKKKVVALQEIIELFTGTQITAKDVFYAGEELSGIVIFAVDRIITRQKIWQRVELKPAIPLIIDGRMGGRQCNVYSIHPCDPGDRKYFAQSFKNHLAPAEPQCGQQSIMYIGLLIAAIIGNQLTEFANGRIPAREVIVEMNSLQLLTP